MRLLRGVVEDSKARFSQLAGLGGGGGGAGGASGRSFHQDIILSDWDALVGRWSVGRILFSVLGRRVEAREIVCTADEIEIEVEVEIEIEMVEWFPGVGGIYTLFDDVAAGDTKTMGLMPNI